MESFFEYTQDELKEWFRERKEQPYRANQLFNNIYRRELTDFQEMTDLPLELRGQLAESFDLGVVKNTKVQESQEDNSKKYLWELPDGKVIESVFMEADYRETICFSTQVGCAFNCSFCITAKMGRIRQLTAGEIVAQIFHLIRLHKSTERGINLVAMGMGEPLDNLDALLKAIAIIRPDNGLGIVPKRITISTVGVVPGIDRLAEEAPTLKLALSLNATTNEVRRQLMPVTKKYPLEVLLPAIERYSRASKHPIMLEYVMIRGLNDTLDDAKRLANIANRFPSKVNVIPFNPSELFPYERPLPEEVNRFAGELAKRHSGTTVRYSKGLDILAACGQLGYDQVLAKQATA